MKTAIIGGGITGLTAAYDLARNGEDVELFEKEHYLGGLASGFREPGWEWPLEGAYHHIFTNDTDIIRLSGELGIGRDILFLRPLTATIWKSGMYRLDSPGSLLAFPGLPVLDRIRTGFMLGLMKVNPFWQPLERFTARDVFEKIGGRRAWETIWEPLMVGKFDTFADNVSAAWLWARIKKRTPQLGYFRGGFAHFTGTLASCAREAGATIRTGVIVSGITPGSRRVTVRVDGKNRKFDRVLVTAPSPVFAKLAPRLPAPYINRLLSIPHLHAHILILETTKPILEKIYWLNITDRSFPFLAAVAHTNFIDSAHYGRRHLTYFGNYLPQGHALFDKSRDEVFAEFTPFIRRLNPAFRTTWVTGRHLFVGPFAQPVHTLRYSNRAPALDTPLPNVFLANMDSIVPWDRGTNYAVRLGRKAALHLLSGE